jgi:hypothetical protein
VLRSDLLTGQNDYATSHVTPGSLTLAQLAVCGLLSQAMPGSTTPKFSLSWCGCPGSSRVLTVWKTDMQPLHLTRVVWGHRPVTVPMRSVSPGNKSDTTPELATGFDPVPTYIPSTAPSKGNQQIRLMHAKRERRKLGQWFISSWQLVDLEGNAPSRTALQVLTTDLQI